MSLIYHFFHDAIASIIMFRNVLKDYVVECEAQSRKQAAVDACTSPNVCLGYMDRLFSISFFLISSVMVIPIVLGVVCSKILKPLRNLRSNA